MHEIGFIFLTHYRLGGGRGRFPPREVLINGCQGGRRGGEGRGRGGGGRGRGGGGRGRGGRGRGLPICDDTG